MLNEVGQWIALFLLGFLLLGVLRQVGLALPPMERAAETGPRVGSRVPRNLMAELRTAFSSQHDGNPDSVVVAFVAESCTACARLLASLEASPTRQDGKSIALVARQPSAAYRRALLDTGVATIVDQSGGIWRSCQVTATPLLLDLTWQGRVLEREVTHRVHDFAAAASSNDSARSPRSATTFSGGSPA
jgi:hypothetical protein